MYVQKQNNNLVLIRPNGVDVINGLFIGLKTMKLVKNNTFILYINCFGKKRSILYNLIREQLNGGKQ